MKQKLLPFFSLLLFSFCVKAQNCDPWIVKAYQELYQKTPSSEECNIRNYNNGSWNNYNELVSYIKAYKTKNSNNPSNTAVKGDPWILQIYKELYNRTPSAWEVNIQNYNSGSWNNYDELKKYIQDFQTSLGKSNISIITKDAGDGKSVAFLMENGQAIAVALVNQNGGQIVAAGGGNVVAAGGGNVISPGGANMQNLSAMNLGGRYSIQSAGTRIIPVSGKSAITVR